MATDVVTAADAARFDSPATAGLPVAGPAPATPAPPGAVAARPPGRSGRLARAAVRRVAARITGGRLRIDDAEGSRWFGEATGEGGLEARVTIGSAHAYRALLHGSRGFAESFIAGEWDTDDLVTLIRILARSLGPLDSLRVRWATLALPARRLAASTRTNSRARSRDNVHRHYDLGNDFFALVLDETMGYSCALYDYPGQPALDASRANLERVCRLLDIRPGERLLEMGSGWGGLAVHAAEHHGARVSTVTISANQQAYIEALARRRGVADRVEVILSDYRDVRGTWDKLVSLEMVESIGADHLDAFVGQCGRLLRDDGLMLMQAITTTDRLFRIDRYRQTFLNQLIFPGGCVPSLEAILDSAARRTRLRAVAVHDITEHYPPTLRAWRARLQMNWTRIQELGGYDEPFRRLWTLYFAYCEAGFLERRVLDRQIVLAGPDWRDENRLL